MSRGDQTRKALLAVDVPARYTYNGPRDKKKAAAIASGYSSVRISKATLAKLKKLAVKIGLVGEGWGEYSWSTPPLTELLDWLADAAVIKPDAELVAACKAAIAGKHAKSAGGKCMQSPRPRKSA